MLFRHRGSLSHFMSPCCPWPQKVGISASRCLVMRKDRAWKREGGTQEGRGIGMEGRMWHLLFSTAKGEVMEMWQRSSWWGRSVDTAVLFPAGQTTQEAHGCTSCSAVTACGLGHLMVVVRSLASVFLFGLVLICFSARVSIPHSNSLSASGMEPCTPWTVSMFTDFIWEKISVEVSCCLTVVTLPLLRQWQPHRKQMSIVCMPVTSPYTLPAHFAPCLPPYPAAPLSPAFLLLWLKFLTHNQSRTRLVVSLPSPTNLSFPQMAPIIPLDTSLVLTPYIPSIVKAH